MTTTPAGNDRSSPSSAEEEGSLSNEETVPHPGRSETEAMSKLAAFAAPGSVHSWRQRKLSQTTRQGGLPVATPGRGTGVRVVTRAQRRLTNADGTARLHVVFVHPSIHWNTGNIGRTCLGLGAELHLIKPLGFSLDARQIRRAGLDYWEHVAVHVYEGWEEFAEGRLQELGGERYFFTKFGKERAERLEWPERGNVVLVFGSEVCGFDGIRGWLEGVGAEERTVVFPMVDERFRSFNLSTSASMALWDAYRHLENMQENNIGDCLERQVGSNVVVADIAD